MNIKSYNPHNLVREKKLNNNKLFDKHNFSEHKQETNINTHRPAQAISFGGSAALGQGLEKSGKKLAHNIINFVYENEAAYVAIYSLFIAGILKPLCVLNMPGSEEKDKQIVATKNFLQAFVGSFMGLTVGGGLVKKSIDVIKNNLKLIVENPEGNGFKVTDDTETLEKMAKKILKEDKSSFKTKYNYIKDSNENISKPKALWQALRKKAVVAENKPKNLNHNEIWINITEKDIKDKVKQLKDTVNEHLEIFNKNFDFVKSLKTNNEELLQSQRENLSNLIKKGASKEEITKQYKTLRKSVLDSIPRDLIKKHRADATKKLDELGSSLNKKDIEESLNALFDSIKDKKIQESLMDTFESVWKNSTGWITVIGKAKVSSLLLPIVTAALFAKKNAEKQKAKEQKHDGVLENSAAFNKEKENFDIVLNKNNKTNSMSFSGAVDKSINALAKGVERISTSKPGQKAVNAIHTLPIPLNKTSARMGDLESFIITGYWLQNTARSKKIDPEQKLGLNIHTLAVTIVSSLAAFVLDTALDPILNKRKEIYKNDIADIAKDALKSKNIEETIEKGCEDILDGKEVAKKLKEVLQGNPTEQFFKEGGELIENTSLYDTIEDFAKKFSKKTTKFKSLTIFTAVVRFLIPVIMVPISGALKQMVKKKKKEKEEAQKVTQK